MRSECPDAARSAIRNRARGASRQRRRSWRSRRPGRRTENEVGPAAGSTGTTTNTAPTSASSISSRRDATSGRRAGRVDLERGEQRRPCLREAFLGTGAAGVDARRQAVRTVRGRGEGGVERGVAGETGREQPTDGGGEQHEFVARGPSVRIRACRGQPGQHDLGVRRGESALHLRLRELEDARAGSVGDLQARDRIAHHALDRGRHREDGQPDRAPGVERGRGDEREVDVDEDLGVHHTHPLDLQLFAGPAQPFLVGEQVEELAAQGGVAVDPEVADPELLDRHLLDARAQQPGRDLGRGRRAARVVRLPTASSHPAPVDVGVRILAATGPDRPDPGAGRASTIGRTADVKRGRSVRLRPRAPEVRPSPGRRTEVVTGCHCSIPSSVESSVEAADVRTGADLGDRATGHRGTDSLDDAPTPSLPSRTHARRPRRTPPDLVVRRVEAPRPVVPKRGANLLLAGVSHSLAGTLTQELADIPRCACPRRAGSTASRRCATGWRSTRRWTTTTGTSPAGTASGTGSRPRRCTSTAAAPRRRRRPGPARRPRSAAPARPRPAAVDELRRQGAPRTVARGDALRHLRRPLPGAARRRLRPLRGQPLLPDARFGLLRRAPPELVRHLPGPRPGRLRGAPGRARRARGRGRAALARAGPGRVGAGAIAGAGTDRGVGARPLGGSPPWSGGSGRSPSAPPVRRRRTPSASGSARRGSPTGTATGLRALYSRSNRDLAGLLRAQGYDRLPDWLLDA